MICSVCSTPVEPGTSARYELSAVHGRLCEKCRSGLDGAVGAWLTKRVREVNREADALERARDADERQARRVTREHQNLQRSLRDEMFPDLRRRKRDHVSTSEAAE